MVQERISIQRVDTSLQVTSDLKGQFKHITTWAFILSGIGFLLISILVAGALLSATNMGLVRGSQSLSPIFIGTGYLIVSILLFFPTFSLFQFGLSLKKALKEDDQTAMNGAFGYLKSGLRYGGLAVLGLLIFGGLGSFM